jgi:hypothetical protein
MPFVVTCKTSLLVHILELDQNVIILKLISDNLNLLLYISYL